MCFHCARVEPSETPCFDLLFADCLAVTICVYLLVVVCIKLVVATSTFVVVGTKLLSIVVCVVLLPLAALRRVECYVICLKASRCCLLWLIALH